MNGYNRKGFRVLAALIALVMLLGVPGIARTAKADASGYYLVGSMNGWAVNAAYKLAQNASATVTEYMITLDLAAGAEFKIVYSSDGASTTAWYPGGANCTVSEAGNYTVYFRPDYNGGSDWYEGCIYAAKNEIPTYAVTVTTDGNGTAATDPTEAKAGDTVTVTITPNEGYLFDTLTGAPEDWAYDEQTGKGTFTMPAANVTLSVTFKEKPLVTSSVYTKVTGEGSIEAPAQAPEGDTVTVTATPAEGYALHALLVNGLDVTADYMQNGFYSFTMPGYAVTIEAVFDAVGSGEHYVHVFVYGLGTAFADKTTAAAGETVTITAEHDVGYVFSHIEVNGNSQGPGVLTFTMPDADVTVNVVFERRAYAINLHSAVQGTMNAIPRNNEAYSDTTVQIVVNADEDYAIEQLTVKNDTTNETIETTLKEQDGQTSIYTFTMPASPVTVTATYHKKATNGYYLIGLNGWTADRIDGTQKFVDDLSVSGQMLLTVDLSAGQEFKVVKVVDGTIEKWYPATGSNYTVDSAHAGSCVVYFRPEYGGAGGWFQNCIFVKKLENDFYLVNIKDSGNAIRWDDKLFINKEFNANAIINSKGESIYGLYGSEYEHMVLTWLNASDKIKVVKVQNGDITEWLPDEMGTEYPTFRYHDGEYAQDPAFTGMVFVFFEEQIGKVGKNYPRIDWTNHVFDVQKAYKADAAEKASVNPLNAESLTYNLEHGSIALSTGTAFIREGRSDAADIPADTSDIIYELGLNQKVYCSIIAEAGYALDGTPYITYGSSTVNMTKDGNRWYFTMPSADVVIHAPMRKVFRTQSVLLSGQIGVNFFVDLAGLDKENCRMKFTVGSAEPVWDDFDPDHHSTVTPSNFGFTCFINAIQMADNIKAELYCGDEMISYKNYSLQEYVIYFDRADSSQANNEAALRVIRAMMDFGYYAQQYLFAVKPDIADDYAPVERHYANVYDYESIKTMTASHSLSANPENKDLGESDVDRVTLQLAVDSATALLINVYMKSDVVPTMRVGSVSLSVGDTDVAYNRWKLSLKENGTRCYQLRIAGISPHNLDLQFTVRGEANGSFMLKASAFSYIDSMLNASGAAEAAKMLAASMFKFHEAEVAYRQAAGLGN